jgi:hypothetical protein
LDAEPLQFGFVRFERGNGGVAFHGSILAQNGKGQQRELPAPISLTGPITRT